MLEKIPSAGEEIDGKFCQVIQRVLFQCSLQLTWRIPSLPHPIEDVSPTYSFKIESSS
jgi:hypothetical protein